ncbi:ParB/RepB/Spo0J family partition protein [Burkholderia aenigmatica]|uniref:ParB/RepB/Spo0J family partition protein n=1 Tax=Burkholderia aenigmatica TaxID=2015348 RepID=UPI002652CA84|nr:ParB/RepB/Spo0J family partition protein [Burkholderia aenigmatica]MDN7880076.1 ParB/RepB/Spo0J family partition protein [Burkholderia aenigmatica]
MSTATAAKKTNSKPSLGSVGKLSGLLKSKDAGAGGAAPNGKPLDLPMDKIREDPKNPRKIFVDDQQFEKSIEVRGVKSPISVRQDPENPGGYIINHGARRFRANGKAGNPTIPGFIDDDYTDFDQVIENIQREGLKARELADFIGGKLAEGFKQAEIAARLQLSPATISQHATLLNLPEAVAEVFNSNRCTDVTLINDLVKAHKAKPEEVKDWLDDPTQEITRGTVKLLREFLDESKQSKDDENPGSNSGGGDGDGEGAGGPTDAAPKERKSDPTKLKKAILQVTHYDRPARLILNRRPTEVGLAWFKYDDDGEEFEAAITEAKLVAIVEGE